jgi:hypothetical protein
VNFRQVCSADEGFRRDTEQIEGLELYIGELRWEGLNSFVPAQQRMALCEAEESQELLGGGSLAQTLFGVDGQFFDLLALHGLAQLALDEGLNQQRQEIQGEQRLGLHSAHHGHDYA